MNYITYIINSYSLHNAYFERYEKVSFYNLFLYAKMTTNYYKKTQRKALKRST